MSNVWMKVGAGLVAVYMLLSLIFFMIAPNRMPGSDPAEQQRYMDTLARGRTLNTLRNVALFGGLACFGVGWLQKKKSS